MEGVLRTRSGLRETIGIAVLYATYEGVRGFGSATLETARAHTASIVSLEQGTGVFTERAIQHTVAGLPVLPMLLGVAYMTLHFAATAGMLVWVHRAHRDAFAIVRTTLVLATGISLAVYVLYPAAPPRLAGLGFADTVTQQAHVNLSSDALGSLYNPFAAVPSLHFGYALIVGVTIATLARRRWVRVVGAAYPPFMLFTIVATGNHFFFDAAAGGLVVVASAALSSLACRSRRASRTRPIPTTMLPPRPAWSTSSMRWRPATTGRTPERRAGRLAARSYGTAA